MSLARPRRRTDAERFDLYTRWSLYVLLLMVPLLALAVLSEVGGQAPGAAALYGLGTLVHTAVLLKVTSAALTRYLGGPAVGRGWLLALGATATGLAVVAVTALPLTQGLTGRTGAVLLALGTTLLVLTPVLSTRAIGVAVVALASGVAGLVQLDIALGRVADENLGPLNVLIVVLLMAGSMAVSFRASAWMLGVVWEQERVRTVHARLAVAEERLRFSRDLHDVVGRTLSAVAVKSELAAELARRGQDGAADQMIEVRELAQDSLREVRAVVAGYRSADLAAELAGARSVLRSAGVATRVVGDGGQLPTEVQHALAWVVREAVTNVVRHAHATTCTIDLAVRPDPEPHVRLLVTNDGVTRAPAAGAGSGLVGLAERLTAVGGELEAVPGQDSFTVQATVPLPQHAIEPATMEPR